MHKLNKPVEIGYSADFHVVFKEKEQMRCDKSGKTKGKGYKSLWLCGINRISIMFCRCPCEQKKMVV